MNTAIVVAAGKSERMGANLDKAFLSLGSKPLIAWSLMALEACPDIDQIILVVRKDQQQSAKGLQPMFGISKLRKIISGGARRQDSVQAGMSEMDPGTRLVVVHDGARPCVTPELISEVVKAAKRNGCAVAASRIWEVRRKGPVRRPHRRPHEALGRRHPPGRAGRASDPRLQEGRRAEADRHGRGGRRRSARRTGPSGRMETP